MKKLAVTTVARWMTERLPSGVTAYMKHQNGRLYRLKRIESYNNWLQPIFAPPWARADGSEFIGGCRQTPSSLVYLSMDPNLTNTIFADFVDTVELVASDDWVTRVTPRYLTTMCGKPDRSRWLIKVMAGGIGIGVTALAWLFGWLIGRQLFP